jgi:predicted RecB family nuclease
MGKTMDDDDISCGSLMPGAPVTALLLSPAGGTSGKPITASHLYDFIHCPHRVTMDLVGNPAQRDPVSPFVELLWERGNAYEHEVIERLSKKTPILDLSAFKEEDKERRTLVAMHEGASLIYSGRLSAGDLQGNPDLLRREGSGYIPIDIKSGQGEAGGDDETNGKPKLHYAAQLALYVEILERLGFSAGRRGIILDINGDEVAYDLSQSRHLLLLFLTDLIARVVRSLRRRQTNGFFDSA